MASLFFRRKSFISKLTSFFTIAALTLQLVAPFALTAHAVTPPPNVVGDYTIELTCTGGEAWCIGLVLNHSLTIDSEDMTTGSLGGHGHSVDTPTTTWTLSGSSIIDSTVTFHLGYDAQEYTMDLNGTRSADGNMSGTATDSIGDSFSWKTTSIPPMITVTATKIVCDNEADLPNWGAGLNNPPEEITAEFASTWLAQHETCHLQSGWDFQYGDQTTSAPDDALVGVAPGYTTFGAPTGDDGTTTVTIPVTNVTEVHLAEVLQDGYIPFTALTYPGNTNDVTAEFYCSSDIYNYDNYEGIGEEEQTAHIVPGAHYYCVAWNAHKSDDNDETPHATIDAQKVICDAEADLPNWGAGGHTIDSTTAQAWVDQSEGKCHLAPDWKFQWGDQNAPDAGRDFRGEAGDGYTTFTNTTDVPLTEGLSQIHLREVLPQGYIPFTFDQSHQDNSNSVSAEFYCSGDALNYDNWDFITSPQAGNTYNCVGFNTIDRENPPQEPKQCDIVSDETNVVQESGDPAVATFVHAAWAHPSWMAPAAPFAKWIWSSFDVGSPTTDETKTFIKEFNLSDIPLSATIDVAADNGYTLYVNGVMVGPDRIAFEHNYESAVAFPVTNLVVGTNTIKMVVKNFAGNPNPHDNPAGALYRLHIEGGTCTNPQPSEGIVHIFKFIDGEQATNDSAGGVSFPMHTPTFDNAPFTLGPNGWTEGDAPYEASTGTMFPGSSYTANEDLTTDLVGDSCEAGKPYALVGYSSGSTLEAAAAAPQSTTAPDLFVDGDQYLIVHNHKCSEGPTPTFLKVHVFKYLKVGDIASQIVNGDEGVAPTKFPMHSSWDATNIGAGEADYVLGDAHGGAAFDYAADTSSMQAPADYTTQELTDSESGVLPIGAQCSPNRFRLVGYKSGDTLIDAQGAAISPTAPVYTDITSDKYIIVVNEDCDDVPPPVIDMCPNLEGDQGIVPDGYHINNDGQCVPNVSVDTTQCSDDQDNDDDGLVDSADPGCHTDGNASNPDSYDASDNNETDESGGGGGGGGSRHSSGKAGGSVLGASIGPVGQVLGDSMCSEYIHTYIKFGQKNDKADVIRLQAFLNTYMHSLLMPTGVYNKETFDVLKAFQVKESGQVLTPWKVTPGGISDAGTGYVYKTTKRWINMIKCPQLNLPVPNLTH